MTPERFARLRAVLDNRQPDLTVVTDEVHKQRNLAAILRNCDAAGVDTLHCVHPAEGYQTYSRTSASAEKWVQVCHYERVVDALNSLKSQGFQIVACALGDHTVDYREVDYCLPTAIVMGAELKGLSAEVCALSDCQVVVPMLGMVQSLNVSVASAIILAQAQSQRLRAGMYERRRLPEDLYRRRFFHWAHPRLAQYCDQHNLDYPAVGEDGEVIELAAWYKKVRQHAGKKKPDASGGRTSGEDH